MTTPAPADLTAPNDAIAARHAALLARPGLAAIDLDGTLLGPDLTVSPDNRRAIARLRAAGFEVVIASGRHHTSVRPHAESVGGVQWIVSTQGSEVSDLTRTIQLGRAFLAADKLAAVLALRPVRGATTLFYTPEGILTDAAECDDLRIYRELTGLRPRQVDLATARAAAVYKMVWVMKPDDIAALLAQPAHAALDVQTVRSHADLIEFMAVGVDKATGLATLAAHLGLTAAQIVGFGDAENDIPMFDWAAISYAMPHGWPRAKARATYVAADGPAETAFARAVDHLLG